MCIIISHATHTHVGEVVTPPRVASHTKSSPPTRRGPHPRNLSKDAAQPWRQCSVSPWDAGPRCPPPARHVSPLLRQPIASLLSSLAVGPPHTPPPLGGLCTRRGRSGSLRGQPSLVPWRRVPHKCAERLFPRLRAGWHLLPRVGARDFAQQPSKAANGLRAGDTRLQGSTHQPRQRSYVIIGRFASLLISLPWGKANVKC